MAVKHPNVTIPAPQNNARPVVDGAVGLLMAISLRGAADGVILLPSTYYPISALKGRGKCGSALNSRVFRRAVPYA
ncbi:hypothetical protein C1876_05470 [Eggerthella sinensis]|uniref:Uncharacterized protein n=1 Tax=Eggerthella sinensis TaxID=242230 RepID=A0ABX9HML1_9ACTN|nr:hypothetical protein C1876_05470 [Eggerthella sinensis]